MASLIMVSLIMFLLLLLISCSEAREIVVGGTEDSWKVPLPSPDSLNQWANTQNFTIGDALIFRYDKKTESVHVVNETDYRMCNTVGKHKVLKDGNSKLLLKSSKPIYIISGNKSHCNMGLKMLVLPMSSKHHGRNSSHRSPAPSPSPSPSPLQSPSLSPPTSHGVVGSSSGGFAGVMTSLGVSLVMKVFLVV